MVAVKEVWYSLVVVFWTLQKKSVLRQSEAAAVVVEVVKVRSGVECQAAAAAASVDDEGRK